ncbi:MAG: hypothetical protein V2A70_10055, partial [Candidatus Omnitrophota bacterium]
AESQKLIKYFLASLTIKEEDLWVNLSPYEKDRMIANDLGSTELGRDMLAQDYILKQLTASMIYPEKDLGKAFWDRVYTKAQEQFGSTDIPVDTFNKVWIVADKAKVFERNNVAYVVGAHLKVMLDSDYEAANQNGQARSLNGFDVGDGPRAIPFNGESQELAKNIIREIILPELEKEVNQGQNFVPLRQMFYTMILATWYKVALKDALLNQVYSDKAKTSGVLSDDPAVKDKIYAQYLEAYKVGVFNYIKEESVGAIHESPVRADQSLAQADERVSRKYFSGGLKLMAPLEVAKGLSQLSGDDKAMLAVKGDDMAMAQVQIEGTVSDRAMKVYVAPADFQLMNLKLDMSTDRVLGAVDGHFIGDVAIDLNDSRTKDQLTALLKLVSLEGAIFSEAKVLLHVQGGKMRSGALAIFREGKTDPDNIILLDNDAQFLHYYDLARAISGSVVIKYPAFSLVRLTGINFGLNHAKEEFVITPKFDAAMNVFADVSTRILTLQEKIDQVFLSQSDVESYELVQDHKTQAVTFHNGAVLTLSLEQESYSGIEQTLIKFHDRYTGQYRLYSLVGNYLFSDDVHRGPVTEVLKDLFERILQHRQNVSFFSDDKSNEMVLVSFDKQRNRTIYHGLTLRRVDKLVGLEGSRYSPDIKKITGWEAAHDFLIAKTGNRMAEIVNLNELKYEGNEDPAQGIVLQDKINEVLRLSSTLWRSSQSGDTQTFIFRNDVMLALTLIRDNRLEQTLATFSMKNGKSQILSLVGNQLRESMDQEAIKPLLQLIARHQQDVVVMHNSQESLMRIVTYDPNTDQTIYHDLVMNGISEHQGAIDVDPLSDIGSVDVTHKGIFAKPGVNIGFDDFSSRNDEASAKIDMAMKGVVDTQTQEYLSNAPLTFPLVQGEAMGVSLKISVVGGNNPEVVYLLVNDKNELIVSDFLSEKAQKKVIDPGDQYALKVGSKDVNIKWDGARVVVEQHPSEDAPLIVTRGVFFTKSNVPQSIIISNAADTKTVKLDEKFFSDGMFLVSMGKTRVYVVFEDGKKGKGIISVSVYPQAGSVQVNEELTVKVVDAAASNMDTLVNGGIDLNARNMGLDVTRDGKGVEMKLDPAMVAEFQKGNFTGVQGIILKIVPIQSPMVFLGLETSPSGTLLAKG